MRQWHLDCAFPADLFQGNWSSESTTSLLALFRYMEKAKKPVLSMLPPSVSPAGAAAMAAMYFLPGLKAPGLPHCRIALFPGYRFISHLRELNFSSKTLLESASIARIMGRGTFKLSFPVSRMQSRRQEVIRQGFEDEIVNFHWIWPCQRVWTRYNQVERQEITPRNYFGRDDNTEAIIDMIEAESPEKVCADYGCSGDGNRSKVRGEIRL